MDNRFGTPLQELSGKVDYRYQASMIPSDIKAFKLIASSMLLFDYETL